MAFLNQLGSTASALDADFLRHMKVGRKCQGPALQTGGLQPSNMRAQEPKATHAANAFLYTNPGYQIEDFEPIGMIGVLPLVYVASNGSPVNNIRDLIRASRAKPDALNIAISKSMRALSFVGQVGAQLLAVKQKLAPRRAELVSVQVDRSACSM